MSMNPLADSIIIIFASGLSPDSWKNPSLLPVEKAWLSLVISLTLSYQLKTIERFHENRNWLITTTLQQGFHALSVGERGDLQYRYPCK